MKSSLDFIEEGIVRMNEVLGIVIQTLATVVAVSTLFWRILKGHSDMIKKMQEQITRYERTLLKPITEHEGKVDRWRREMENQWRSDVTALNARMNDQETLVLSAINERLSKIEGEMRGVRNILIIIQEHFIIKGGKG